MAVLLGLVFFVVLWILYIPWREIYTPPDALTFPLLADGLLLTPGARWQDWFTRGYSHFWDLYPDWKALYAPPSTTAFARPGFQFLIYLAHFILDRDWASYQLLNNAAIAGMVAAAFYIANRILTLPTAPSLVSAILVLLSPPVLESWWSGVGFAIEPLATFFVAGAAISVIARRDFLCFGLLFLALFTKENAVWAPFAAAATVLLRPKPDEPRSHQVVTAAAMLLPVAMWLVLRFAFFGGIGGTYATAGYTPIETFLRLTFDKLTHLHYLFIIHKVSLYSMAPRGAALLILDRATALLIYTLLSLWVFRIFSEALNNLRHAIHEWRWQPVDAVLLVSLWAAIALAFHFALPMHEDRYATSFVVFAWPALVAEVERRRKMIIRLALVMCCLASLTRSSYFYIERIARPAPIPDYKAMDSVLRQVPSGTRQIYVLSAGSLLAAHPDYVRLFHGAPSEIVRISDIHWSCDAKGDSVGFNHKTTDGVVILTVTLPRCAKFYFPKPIKIPNNRLQRTASMSYDLPEARPRRNSKWWYLGRRMIVQIRPNGPARFVIEHGTPDGIAWFDTP